ncbi:MAG: pectate lyase [Muribaculaceae bacterium]|nr:pectate lyase [Muribaculaceae bacterium]
MKVISTTLRGLFAALLMSGLSTANAETVLCSFIDGNKTNITLTGTSVEGSAKYQSNKVSVPCLMLKNGYLTNDVWNDNAINLDCTGGFKAGDVVTIQGFFNNSDTSKKSAVKLVSLGADNAVTEINRFPDFINGRVSDATPEKSQFTLEADFPNLKLVRDGDTGTNLMYITVIRDAGTPGGDEPDVPNPPASEDHSVNINPNVNQMVLTTSANDVKYYNTASISAVDFDAASGTVSVTNGDWTDNYQASINAISFAKAQATGGEGGIVDAGVTITEAKGWAQSCYAKFNVQPGLTYDAYIKGGDYQDFTKVDKELVRNYGTYGRVDVPGLHAGTYSLKIVARGTNSEGYANDMTVVAFDRSGFAFKDMPDGLGAYTLDGRLKPNAVVVYVTAKTAKTVTCDIMTDANKNKYETFTGFQDIVYGLQKGAEKRPICIRVVGTITAGDMDSFGSSAEGLQIKGKNSYSPLNLTIEGIGDDAAFHGFGLLLRNTSSVEISNLGILWCMDDAVSIDTDNSNIWVHHLDLFYGQPGSDSDQAKGDGTLDIKGDSKYTTFAYNHLWDNGKASLCGMKSESGPNYIDYHHNWFDHSDSRHPRIRTMTVHVWNNYYDGVSKYGVGAAMNSNAFMEANYFRHTKNPALASKQGTDIKGDGKGTFSGENGGIIKSYGNLYTDNSGVPVDYHKANVEFDVYEATSRDEKVPAEVKAKQGGRAYDNFDTDPSLMHVYTPDTAADIPSKVTGYYGAGRLNKGDFTWTFTSSDDTSYDVNKALQTAIKDYKSTLVGVFE